MAKKIIALFPGSFDPITLGHIELVERGLQLFDEVVISLGTNSQKQTMFTLEQRMGWIQQQFASEPRIRVTTFTGLTVNYAQSIEARYLLRGLRNAPDYEYEKSIDLLNKHLSPAIDTVYLISSPDTQHISSSLVREVIKYGGKLQGLIPEHIIQDIAAGK